MSSASETSPAAPGAAPSSPSGADGAAPPTRRRRLLPPRALAAARTARSWVRSGPLSALLAVVLLLATAVQCAAQHRLPPALHSNVLSADLAHPWRPWPLLTAWAGTVSATPLVGVVVLLVVGVSLERFLGSRRLAASAVLTHAIGVLLVLLAHPLIARAWPSWGRQMESHGISGTALALMGPLMAATALMEPLWRRRTRVLGLGTVVLIAAVTGTPGAIAVLGACLAGLVIGLVPWWGRAAAWGRGARARLPRTRRSERNLVAMLTASWALILILTVASRAVLGPLSSARLGILPPFEGPVPGAGAALLAVMPMVLQLVLAEGLRRGRRAAAIGTVALQTLLAVCSLLSVIASESWSGRLVELYSPRWFARTHLMVPLLLNVAVILIVVWNRADLELRSRRGVVRTAAAAWAGAVVALGAMSVVLGMTVQDRFSPEATWADLALDYVIRLLPTTASGFLEPLLVARGPIAHLALRGMPTLAWAAAVLITGWALSRPAVTAPARQEDLNALVRSEGAGSLGWMLTWPGNEAWVSRRQDCGFAFRQGSGVALTLGDPACSGGAEPAAVASFASFAVDAGLVPALYSVHEPAMLAARERGWTVLQVAEEAVIDLPGLAFKGKAFQDVRTALNHSRREGITAEWTTWRSAPAGRRDQIRAISQGWADDKALPEMGFTLGGLTEIDDDETRLLLAVDEQGTVHAVTSWMPIHRDGEVIGLTLDVMRRREGGWRPAIEFLIARAAQDAQAEGLEVLSLSGAPLSRSGVSGDVTGDGHDDVGAARFDPLLDLLASVLEPAYGFSSLHSFKRKFQPRSVPLYLAVPDVLDLPAVGLAVARAYVPDLTAAQAARFAQVLVSRG